MSWQESHRVQTRVESVKKLGPQTGTETSELEGT